MLAKDLEDVGHLDGKGVDKCGDEVLAKEVDEKNREEAQHEVGDLANEGDASGGVKLTGLDIGVLLVDEVQVDGAQAIDGENA